MYKAFPCSDYYGGSVAMSDFQRHLSFIFEIYHLTALRIAELFRRSDLGNPRLDNLG